MGLVLLLFGCSTKKNTFTRRLYHNLTSQYNAYFNGKESFKEGVAIHEKTVKDDYGKVLPVYKFTTEETASSIFPQMDRTILKVSKVIGKHSIFVKGKEHCRWIDDAYLLMGKADFYKCEYYTAIEIFRFIPARFKDSPLRFNSMLWLARTYIELGKFQQAQNIFNTLDDKKNRVAIPESLLDDIEATRAWYHIRQGNYYLAIAPLAKAVSLTKKKKDKMRLTFILAQLYQRNDEPQLASDLFGKVLKYNPPYDFAFNARINRAMLFSKGSKKGEEIKKELAKMARDSKNKDYLDQIYFALASIALAERNKPLGLEYLKKSAALSVSNNTQKALSFLKLGELYFEKPNYDSAQVYYDSAIVFLPEDYPEYAKIKDLSQTLNRIAENMKEIQLQDSLLKLSAMTPAQREAVVNKIIEEIVRQEQLVKQQEQLQQLAMMNNNTQNNILNNNAAAGNKWYYYNPTAVSFGKNEFKKRWGTRKLEDNWRRSNKETMLSFGDNTVEGDSSSIIAAKDLKDKNFYLKNIPTTEEDIAASHEKIRKALYGVGVIFKEDLKDYKQAVRAFEELFRRYPGNEFELKAAYHSYKAYSSLGNTPKADEYKNLILTKYPESDYARLILDPDAFIVSSEELSEADVLYKETWQAFNTGNYSQVFDGKKTAEEKFAESDLIPKFHFLSAMATGKTEDRERFIASLSDVVNNYGASPSGIQAKEMLAVLNPLADSGAVLTDSTGKAIVKPTGPVYEMDEDDFHFFAMIVSVMDNDVNKVKASISDFNTKFFGLEKLMINSVYLDNTRQVITVSKFADSDKANVYLKSFKKNSDIKKSVKGDNAQFIIGSANYAKFYKSKDVEGYLMFFVENY